MPVVVGIRYSPQAERLSKKPHSVTLWETSVHLMIDPLVISVHWQQRQQLVVLNLCGKLSLASCVPEYTRSLSQILNFTWLVKCLLDRDCTQLTDAMGTWTLAIAFCSELVALIASSADPPTNRS